MKSIIEGLFSGLLEGKSTSNNSKNNLSENGEDFSSDISNVLATLNNNTLEEVNLSGTENIEDTDKTKEILAAGVPELKGLKSKVKEEVVDQTRNNGIQVKKNILKIDESKQKNLNMLSNNSHKKEITDFSIKNNEKTSEAIVLKNSLEKNKKTNVMQKSLLDLTNTQDTQRKQKKGKTFFKNYFNFNTAKSWEKNFRLVKLITSNKLIVDNTNTEIKKNQINKPINDQVNKNTENLNLDKTNNLIKNLN